MASNSSSEYKVVADRIVSPDEDIIVTISGAMYKGEIVEAKRYVTVSDIGNAGAVSAEIPFEVDGGALGTQPTFSGAPMFYGSYIVMGPVIHFKIQVEFDNITNFGTGQYYLNLPIPAKYGYDFRDGCLHDDSTGHTYHISGHVSPGETQLLLFTTDLSGQNLYDFPFTRAEPLTLTTADRFHIAGSYIADFS